MCVVLQAHRRVHAGFGPRTLSFDAGPSRTSPAAVQPIEDFVSEDDGGGGDEPRLPGGRRPEQTGPDVGQIDLRVEAAGRGGVRASEIPLQVRP